MNMYFVILEFLGVELLDYVESVCLKFIRN
jgi:hypothetical protein